MSDLLKNISTNGKSVRITRTEGSKCSFHDCSRLSCDTAGSFDVSLDSCLPASTTIDFFQSKDIHDAICFKTCLGIVHDEASVKSIESLVSSFPIFATYTQDKDHVIPTFVLRDIRFQYYKDGESGVQIYKVRGAPASSHLIYKHDNHFCIMNACYSWLESLKLYVLCPFRHLFVENRALHLKCNSVLTHRFDIESAVVAEHCDRHGHRAMESAMLQKMFEDVLMNNIKEINEQCFNQNEIDTHHISPRDPASNKQSVNPKDHPKVEIGDDVLVAVRSGPKPLGFIDNLIYCAMGSTSSYFFDKLVILFGLYFSPRVEHQLLFREIVGKGIQYQPKNHINPVFSFESFHRQLCFDDGMIVESLSDGYTYDRVTEFVGNDNRIMCQIFSIKYKGTECDKYLVEYTMRDFLAAEVQQYNPTSKKQYPCVFYFVDRDVSYLPTLKEQFVQRMIVVVNDRVYVNTMYQLVLDRVRAFGIVPRTESTPKAKDESVFRAPKTLMEFRKVLSKSLKSLIDSNRGSYRVTSLERNVDALVVQTIMLTVEDHIRSDEVNKYLALNYERLHNKVKDAVDYINGVQETFDDSE